jgi:hypothetical protein
LRATAHENGRSQHYHSPISTCTFPLLQFKRTFLRTQPFWPSTSRILLTLPLHWLPKIFSYATVLRCRVHIPTGQRNTAAQHKTGRHINYTTAHYMNYHLLNSTQKLLRRKFYAPWWWHAIAETCRSHVYEIKRSNGISEFCWLF